MSEPDIAEGLTVDELKRQLAEVREQQTATADILKVIASSPTDVQPVLDAVAMAALRFCGATDATIALREGAEMMMAAHEGSLVSPEAGQRDLLDGRTVRGRAILDGVTVHVPDLTTADPGLFSTSQNLGTEQNFRAVVAAPMLREGGVLGCIALRKSEPGPFTPRQIELLEIFAAQAVIAIENVRLFTELNQRTEEVAELNRDLQARVTAQVEELGRVGRLKRFLAPQLAELIVSQGDEKILESHRREIVVVFCDLRGYTAFSETAEPEEVLDFLREYHGALGPLVSQFEGTLDQFSGDGIMVFFNDPMPVPDPAERAVKMAIAMREASSTLIAAWRERGRELGFGAGIAQGYATLGQIGFSERSGYTAIGTVCNVAARLCGEAKDGQILLSQRVNVALKGVLATEQVGTLALKGLTQPVVTYNVPLTTSPPTLRVIGGGPLNN